MADIPLRDYLIGVYNAYDDWKPDQPAWVRQFYFPTANVYIGVSISKLYELLVYIREEYATRVLPPIFEDIRTSNGTPTTEFIYKFNCSAEEQKGAMEEAGVSSSLIHGPYISEYWGRRNDRAFFGLIKRMEPLPNILENNLLYSSKDVHEVSRRLLRSYARSRINDIRSWIDQHPRTSTLTTHQYRTMARIDINHYLPASFNIIVNTLYPDAN